VLSNVSPRNFVLKVFATSLFLYFTCKFIKELVLVANCIYCVLSAFSDNRLIVNHLFISWRILLALVLKSVGFRLVIIMLVSPCIELLQRCLQLFLANHLCKVRKAMIPVGHHALFLSSLN
jgi:hypothetical protein